MSNKDEFNRIAALVLEKIDDQFPVAIMRLDAEDFVDVSDKNALMIFHYTVVFLEKEHLLTYSDFSDEGDLFGEVMLTGKGLAALNSTPDLLKGKGTFRNHITSALKTGSKETLKAAINQLIQAVATGRLDLPG